MKNTWGIILKKYKNNETWNEHKQTILETIGLNTIMKMESNHENITYIKWLYETSKAILNPIEEVFLKENEIYITYNFNFYTTTFIKKRFKHINTQNLITPKWGGYDSDRIRLMQWEGGTHWYAKVDKMDIVDEYGNQKWDDREEAYKHAYKYLTLNTN